MFVIRQPFFEAEGASVGEGKPEPAIDNPLLAEDDSQVETEDQQEGQQEYLDFGGRKIPVVDPALRELHGDWQNQLRYVQEQTQRVKDMERQLEAYQMAFQAMQNQQPQQQPQAPQMSEEERQKLNEQLLERLYEDPLGVLEEEVSRRVQDVLNQSVMPKIEPILKERHYAQVINQVRSKYSDFDQYGAQISQLIQQNPSLADMPNGLEYAYLAAKGMTAQQSNPEQLLSDPGFQERIIQNEEIRRKIVDDYLNSVRTKNKQTPTVMSGHAGGQMPAAPPNKPTSIREASQAALEWFNRQRP